VQREDDFLDAITEFRKQLKMNKEAADEEPGVCVLSYRILSDRIAFVSVISDVAFIP